MKAIVTGAAGFIGSHLCQRLLKESWAVVGIDNFDEFYDPKIKRSNINDCSKNKQFQLVEADLRDSESTNGIISEGADVVVHLAARAGVRPSIAQPGLYADVNINGTVALLEAVRNNHIKKFVFASSSSVYGNNKKVPFSEDDNVDFPISPYAATKKAGELICHTYHHLYEISVTCLRYFTVYGPRQRPDLAIYKFIRLIEQGKSIPVYGDGQLTRDFTYIDDIIDGTVAAINKCAGYHIYNLGESRPITVKDLIAEIEKALGKKAVIEYLPLQPGDVIQTYADITKAAKDLCFTPNTQISDGLKRFVEWFRGQNSGG